MSLAAMNGYALSVASNRRFTSRRNFRRGGLGDVAEGKLDALAPVLAVPHVGPRAVADSWKWRNGVRLT